MPLWRWTAWRSTEHSVRGFAIAHGRVEGVLTDTGAVRANTVVLAAGIWGPALAATVGIGLPMVSVEHPHVFTAPRPELGETSISMPIVRYPDHAVYTRHHGRRYGLGSYAHEPFPVGSGALGASALRPFRTRDFASGIAEATQLAPAMNGAPLERRINDVFALTPDELPLVGESTAVPGLWFAEASWVTHAGGVGRLVANLLLGT